MQQNCRHKFTNSSGSEKMKDIFKLVRKHKKFCLRPNLMYISILHIGKICMNAKFLSEISVNDFNMANKQKFRG